MRRKGDMNPPKTAYILLWFPLASETFVFREVMNLWKLGLPLKVFTLYGDASRNLSEEMLSVSSDMERLGIPFLRNAPLEIAYWLKREPQLTCRLFKTIPIR
jgi:colanic acid/amylovoran biosynthesis glycosyltransferase